MGSATAGWRGSWRWWRSCAGGPSMWGRSTTAPTTSSPIPTGRPSPASRTPTSGTNPGGTTTAGTTDTSMAQGTLVMRQMPPLLPPRTSTTGTRGPAPVARTAQVPAQPPWPAPIPSAPLRRRQGPPGPSRRLLPRCVRTGLPCTTSSTGPPHHPSRADPQTPPMHPPSTCILPRQAAGSVPVRAGQGRGAHIRSLEKLTSWFHDTRPTDSARTPGPTRPPGPVGAASSPLP